ncbi:MAG: penicillin-binding transpeptidase domain-containing protein, partial [Rhodospirillales bacterium]|nr:penicillin-binding transpeptidase domain-containing protein [Rhodospirillales bacterium]
MIFERIRHPFSPTGQSGDGPDVELPDRIVFEGARKQALETGRNRLMVTGVLLALAFVMIGGRVVELTLVSRDVSERPPRLANTDTTLNVRADITDRNGILLATSLPTAALYANPRHVLDADEAAGKLSQVLPDMTVEKARALLSSDKTFVWLHRNLTPKLQFAVNALGIPGLYFQQTERRVYPHGPLVSHVIGMTNIDGKGLSGIEGYFDGQLRGQQQSLQLSLDIRMQAVVQTELVTAMEKFSAIGAAGIVLDVETGEVIYLVSLPDFNPNNPLSAAGIAGFNRATKGVYEMGSTFKLFTAAMALDSGRVRLKDRYDATKPIRISRFKISDYHAKNKWMTVPEILVHSSNIGSAKMALDVGTLAQKKYLKNMGMLSPAGIELPEVGSP